MAFVQDPNQDSSNTAQQGQQTGNFNQPMSVSGSAASSGPGGYKGGGAAQTGNTAASGAPSSSGQFQNLQAYLGANQNYTNSGGLAGQLSSDYNKQAQGINNNITDASKNWYGQNSSADVDPTKASQYVNNALSDPTKFSSDPNNVSQFQGYLNAGTNYVAPGQFDPTQTYQQKVQNYQSQVGQLGTDSGRQAALQHIYGQNNPYYSQGQQGIDNLLLSAGVNAGGQNQIQQLKNNTQGYGQNLNNAYKQNVGDINNSIAQYGQDAATTQANTQNALGGAITGLYDQYANNLSTLAANRNHATDMAQMDLSQGRINSDMAKQFASYDPSMQLYGVNPGAVDSSGKSLYLTQNTNTPTVSNTISASDQAKMTGLGALAGNYLSGTPTADLQALAGNKAAGTFDSTPYTFNAKGLADAVSKAQNDYLQAGRDIFSANPGAYTYTPQVNPNNPSGAYNALSYMINNPSMYGQALPDQNIMNNNFLQLQSLLQKYNIDPTTGNSQGFTTTPDVVSAPSGGPTMGDLAKSGDLGNLMNQHGTGGGTGAMINPITGLPINHR